MSEQIEQKVEQTQNKTNPSTKEVIAYLAEKFPLCFTLEGEVKPLKVGLFQELAEALKDDEKISKRYCAKYCGITLILALLGCQPS